ncbi:PHD finger protein 11 [Phytophthora boehmeriae]|uniref:PHD finger protein 11 n=1 Tax=Phytophthora boehmeriae TaxID=109152 RepID=A0A8T1WLR9_9STRA|nr:PHD finger protein 11 [Phytophthora boehmeriae]
MFFSRSIIGEKRDALLEEMNRTLALPPARDFMYPVDEETFLDYLITVANPIDLTKIQQRLRHGYYRQVEAFLADAKLISINCETYNVQTSGIAQSSRNLYNHMLTQTQRIFPHLLREANNGNSHAANGRGRYTYPPDDFVSNFSVEPVETHLELLEITLLSPTPEGSETTGSTNGAVSTERSTVATSVNTDDIPAVTPSRTTRSLQSEECKESDEEAQMEAIKELIETIDDPDGDLLPTSTLVTTDAAVVVVESDTSSQTPNQQTGSPFRSPRVRRIPRVVATPSRNGDGPTRKRQRTNPDQVLISYSDLLAKLSVAQRDAVKSACEEDLRAVLQDFHEALVQADKGDVFAAPVTDDVAPDYSSVISHPQDFGTMMDRLLKYKSFREYFADVELVFSNAIKYNGWNCYIGGLVEDLQKYCFKFLLDAAGVDHQALKAVSTRARAARSTNRPSPSKSKRLLAPTSKQNTRRKPAAAVLDDDDEDSWNSSSTSESEEDEDEDNEDDLSSAESDWDAPGRKRQLRRPARAANTRKKVKRRN